MHRDRELYAKQNKSLRIVLDSDNNHEDDGRAVYVVFEQQRRGAGRGGLK